MHGQTALHYSAGNDDANVINCLLRSNDTLINIQDKNGNTALHEAARYGALAAVQVLSNHKSCDRERINNNGNTALEVARHWGNSNIIDYFSECSIGQIRKPIEMRSAENRATAYTFEVNPIPYMLEMLQELKQVRSLISNDATHDTVVERRLAFGQSSSHETQSCAQTEVFMSENYQRQSGERNERLENRVKILEQRFNEMANCMQSHLTKMESIREEYRTIQGECRALITDMASICPQIRALPSKYPRNGFFYMTNSKSLPRVCLFK